MIRRAITAYFQWCGKHPWIVFLGAILLSLVIVNAFFRILFDLPPPFSQFDLRSLFRMLLNVLLPFGAGNILLPLVIVLILNRKYVREGSKIGGALTFVAGILIVVGILAAIYIPQKAAYRRRGYDSEVKANIRNAATAQAAYYKVNGTYTANIDSLTGFNQSDYVTIAVEATETTFVITGTITKGCEENTGTWSINSAGGSVSGTPCD